MKVKVTIQGVTPLLMNRFTEENEVKVTSGTSTVQVGDKGTPREQAEPKAYKDKKGMLYVPGTNIYRCLIDAGKFHKVGKSKVTTIKSSLVPAGIMLDELVCPLNTKEFEVDARSIVNPATGGRRMCYRPRLDEWETTFTLDIDEKMFAPDFVRLLIDDAGKKIGLGDYRPARKGPFGRFVVTNWKVQKPKKVSIRSEHKGEEEITNE